MRYDFEKQIPAAGSEDVADIYVVRGVEQQPKPSPELLAALERSSSDELSVVQELVQVGFQAMATR